MVRPATVGAASVSRLPTDERSMVAARWVDRIAFGKDITTAKLEQASAG
jgi:hypothetical protein